MQPALPHLPYLVDVHDGTEPLHQSFLLGTADWLNHWSSGHDHCHKLAHRSKSVRAEAGMLKTRCLTCFYTQRGLWLQKEHWSN